MILAHQPCNHVSAASKLLRILVMDNYIAEISNVDTNSWILVLLMCSWGFGIILAAVKSTAFAVISYPALIYSALAANNFLAKFDYVTRLEKAAALAFATGIGMTAAIIILISLYFVVTGLYQPPAPKRLDLPRSSRTAIE
jgi:hypothetical protein